MDDLEAMRLKAIRDAQQRTRMELLASNPAPQPPTERERDEAHRLLAEQMVQRSLSMQVEALRRREVMKHQLIMQRQAESERAKMEEEEEASVAGGITNGAIADAAVVETGQTDETAVRELRPRQGHAGRHAPGPRRGDVHAVAADAAGRPERF